jgi:hypothetical protein
MASELVDVHLRWKGRHIENFTSQADPEDPEDLQSLLEDAIRRDRSNQDRHITEYDLEVRGKSSRKRITYVGRSR